MADHKPSETSPSDFMETAAKSREAGIADETAGYDQPAKAETSEGSEAAEESSAHPS